MRKVLYILGELEDQDLQWLLDAGSVRRMPTGTEIIQEGRANDSLYIVVEGEFQVSSAGRELARLEAGEVVGDMSLLDSRPPNATVVATKDSIAHSIPQDRLRVKLERDPPFAARFYRALCIFLANRLQQTNAMVGASAARGEERARQDRSSEELLPDTLDSVALAGARFNWFLHRVRKM
jgi:CRP-like cAMP-binding protein